MLNVHTTTGQPEMFRTFQLLLRLVTLPKKSPLEIHVVFLTRIVYVGLLSRLASKQSS